MRIYIQTLIITFTLLIIFSACGEENSSSSITVNIPEVVSENTPETISIPTPPTPPAL